MSGLNGPIVSIDGRIDRVRSSQLLRIQRRALDEQTRRAVERSVRASQNDSNRHYVVLAGVDDKELASESVETLAEADGKVSFHTTTALPEGTRTIALKRIDDTGGTHHEIDKRPLPPTDPPR